MAQKHISQMIYRAYGRDYNLEDYELVPRSQYYMTRITGLFNRARFRWVRYTILLMILAFAVASVYYYNLLVTTEQDVLAANGKVNALLQRRNDISINLSKAVLDYSKHERDVFNAVVTLRSMLGQGSGDQKKPDNMLNALEKSPMKSHAQTSPGTNVQAPISANVQAATKAVPTQQEMSGVFSPLSNLIAIAEQYPDLKLSNTFINLMSALIEIEKDLAMERIVYNDKVNVFTTNLAKFPINLYAMVFGFETKPYFQATEDAQTLKPIDY